jgi:quercetin dioxygenase-like cupin family protein
MTMSKMKSKRMLAGVFVACALITWRVAWATPGAGTTSAVIAGPVTLNEIKIGGDTGGVKIKTNGLYESRVVEFRIAPGGHTGWHSHPGPVFVMITAGAMTLEQADGSTAVYSAGTGFVEEPGQVNIGRNEGTSDLELVAFFLTPLGAPIRTDEPQP